MRRNLVDLFATLTVAAMLAASCGVQIETPEVEDTSEPEPEIVSTPTPTAAPIPTTLVWAHDQEPPNLHVFDPDNNVTATSWIAQGLLEGLYGVTADVTYQPELLATEATAAVQDDGSFTIDYTLRPGLRWSDGTPLTANDVKFTYDVTMATDDETEGDPSFVLSHAEREDTYAAITTFELVSDTTFTVTFDRYVPNWKALFPFVLPAHSFAGGAADVEQGLPDWTTPAGTPLPSSGPLVLVSWDRGSQMTLAANERYLGSTSIDVAGTATMNVEEVIVRFINDPDAQAAALANGDVQILTATPDVSFGTSIASQDNLVVASQPGATWEHLGMNLLNPHLADPTVREAIALWLDKSAIVASVYSPVFDDVISPVGLGNVYLMPGQPGSVDHQQIYAGAQVAEARTRLESVGYVDSGDGIYEHPTRGRLTLRIGTTAGNELREQTQQLLIAQGAAAGFELLIDNTNGADYFGAGPFNDQALLAAASQGDEGDARRWDLALFAWVGGPWPGAASDFFGQRSGFAPYGLASTPFEALATECDFTIDAAERAECFDELSAYVTTLDLDAQQGLFVVPITQVPTFVAYDSQALATIGAVPDDVLGGPLANVVDVAFVQ